MKDYRKFFVALLVTMLTGVHAALTDGSLFLPAPWDAVVLAGVGAVLVLLVRNGDKPNEEK